jgi:hypothetical protein
MGREFGAWMLAICFLGLIACLFLVFRYASAAGLPLYGQYDASTTSSINLKTIAGVGYYEVQKLGTGLTGIPAAVSVNMVGSGDKVSVALVQSESDYATGAVTLCGSSGTDRPSGSGWYTFNLVSCTAFDPTKYYVVYVVVNESGTSGDNYVNGSASLECVPDRLVYGSSGIPTFDSNDPTVQSLAFEINTDVGTFTGGSSCVNPSNTYGGLPKILGFSPVANTTIVGTTTVALIADYFEPSSYHSSSSTVEIALYQGGGGTFIGTLVLDATSSIPYAGVSSFTATATALTNNMEYTPIVTVDGVTIYPPSYLDPMFFVGSNPYPGILHGGIIASTTGACSIGSPSDCYTNLEATIKQKPPFGYIFGIIDSVDTINGSGTPAFSLATSSAVMTNIFTPIRTGLVLILWFATLFWFFNHRIRHVQL